MSEYKIWTTSKGWIRRKLCYVLLVCIMSLAFSPNAVSGQQPPSNNQLIAATQQSQIRTQCPVSIQYSVNLGQAQDYTRVPVFVASIDVMNNNDSITIKSWRMGWQFPFGSTIQNKADVFDTSIALLNPGSTAPVVQTATANQTLDGGTALQFSFLGTKGSEPVGPSNPYSVGTIKNVVFNNLVCTMMNFPLSQRSAAPFASPIGGSSSSVAGNNSVIEIEYAPIEYVGKSLVSTSKQFLASVKNIQNSSVVELSDLAIQYWFEGGPDVVEIAPYDYFEASCAHSNTPNQCNDVVLAISRGFAGVPGAKFAVNVTFNNTAGKLLPTGENAIPGVILGSGLESLTLLITVTTKSGLTLLNATQDYSFLNTPIRTDVPATDTDIVPRQAMLNSRIPAYLKGQLVWGVLPSADATVLEAEMNATTANSSMNDGVFCQALSSQNSQQSCSLTAIYCCTVPPGSGGNSVSSTIPSIWPPKVLGEFFAPDTETIKPSPQPEIIFPLPPPSTNNNTNNGQDSSKSSSSSIVWVSGVAVGIVVVLAAVAGGVFLVLKKKRKRSAAQRHKDSSLHLPTNMNGSNGAANGKFVTFQSGLKGSQSQLDAVHVGLAPVYVRNDGGIASHSLLDTQHSTPDSRAGSQHPLLGAGHNKGTPRSIHDTSGSLNSHLIRLPSGVSAASSEGLNGAAYGNSPSILSPFADLAALGYPPGHITGINNEASPQRASLGATSSPAQQPMLSEEELQNQRDTIERTVYLSLIEKKASTAPALFISSSSRRLLGRRSLSQDEADDAFLGRSDSVQGVWGATMMRRSKSWDGFLSNSVSYETHEHMHRLRRRRTEPNQLLDVLPPLTPLPPPLLPSDSRPATDVDLKVDWKELEGKLGRCLGTGGFGAVYEATWRGKKVAVKMLPPFSSKEDHDGSGRAAYNALLREIQLASKFNSDRLVKVYGACTEDPSRVCLIMELMEGGSLSQRIYDRKKRRLSYLELLQLAHDVAAGLAYLHPSVVHRDLKPQNILQDRDGRVKIADFGISRVKDPTKSYLTQVTNENGTPGYMSPQALSGTRIDEKEDVYALGIILNEAYTRRQPWKDSTHFFQIILKVAINGERPWMDPDTPEPLKRLITKCWHQDPHMRPSCADIMRLTEIMIAEELRRWEKLNAGASPASITEVDRLPSASKAGVALV